MPTVILILLIFLAVYRLTRVVTTDAVPFEEIRESFVRRWGTYDDAVDKSASITGKHTNWFMRKLAYLWECDWCASVWVALVVVGITMQVASVPLPVLVAFAASAVTGLVSSAQSD